MARISTQPEKSRAPMSGVFSSPEKRTLPIALLLVAAVVIVYSPVAHNGFLNFDDDGYITANPHVRAGLTWSTTKWAFTTYEGGNYHPLTWLSHALDCQLYGLEPAAHHEVNVLLHAANAVLLFLLLQTATGLPWRSLFVTALFALHPINVESVAWAAERKNVLSTLFFLLALHAYVAYARRPRLGRYALVALLFVLGLLSKPQVITLPFLLLLFDCWPLRRFSSVPAGTALAEYGASEARSSNGVPSLPRASLRQLAVEKLPLLALSAAAAAVTLKAQKAGGAIQNLATCPPLLRLETALMSYVRYLGKAAWPANLVLFYPRPTVLYPPWQVAVAALSLGLISVVVLGPRSRRYLTVGWLWFLGSLVPMIGFVQVGNQAMADRYAYLPFLGLFVMFTWLAADLGKGFRVSGAWLAMPALAALLALGALTYRQLGYWRDSPTLWTHTLALTGNNYMAHDMLGNYLSEEGRTEEAAIHFHAALAILPGDLLANLGLGIYEGAHGHLQGAIARYRVVALHALQPALRSSAYANLGSAYRQLGDLPTAKQYFEMSLQLAPDRPMPMIGLGLIAQKQGDFDEAIRQYSRAMAIQPTDVGYLLMASALDQQGHTEEARAISERVGRFSPDLAAAEKEADGLLGR